MVKYGTIDTINTLRLKCLVCRLSVFPQEGTVRLRYAPHATRILVRFTRFRGLTSTRFRHFFMWCVVSCRFFVSL